MSVDIESLFAGMAKAEVNGKGTYLDDGVYTVRTKNLFVKKGMNPAKPGDSFICEFEILTSTNEKHPVGSSGSYVLKFTNPYTLGNIVELVTALLGFENTKENHANARVREEGSLLTRAFCGGEKAIAEVASLREALEDPTYGVLTGIELKLETKKGPTKTPGGEYTRHTWTPLKPKAS